MLTPDQMARISAACGPDSPDRWTAPMIEAQLATGTAVAVCREAGFAVLRVAGDEAEILSIDVLPEARRRGLATDILREAMRTARDRGARDIFLEVDTTNAAAIALYEKAGFDRRGLRRAYYRRPDGTRTDALIMARSLSSMKTGDAAIAKG
jgi:ribosomal-protein-alanine N-acetyltransferase